MLWISANDPDDTLAVDDLAVVAHFLDRCPDFHRSSSLPCCGYSAGKMSRAINGNSSIRIDIEQPGLAEARLGRGSSAERVINRHYRAQSVSEVRPESRRSYAQSALTAARPL